MSAHTQDVLGNSARRALDAAAGLGSKRPSRPTKRVRTVRAGRNSDAGNRAGSTAELRPHTRREERLQARFEATGDGTLAAGKASSVASAPAALAPLIDNLRLPEWAKASPVQVVLAGRKVRLGNRAFFLTMVGALTGVLALLLVINTSLAAGTFELQNARENMRDLALKEQMLSNKLSEVESPVGLENKAKAMGMVAAGTSAFIDLNSKTVTGEAEAAQIPMSYATKKKKKKEKADEQMASSDASVVPGTVDPTTGFLKAEAGAGESNGGSGLRPLGLLDN